MKKLKEALATAGLFAALGFAGSAAAQSNLSSWYVGGTVGQAELKDAEIGYHNLDEASAPGGATEGTAWELVGIGTLPLGNQFSAYGKLGVYHGELEAPGAEETNNDLTYGRGLQYDFTRAVGVRGEWQRYSKMGGGAVAETDVDVLNVGAVYRFQ
jgi:opacity protein-like surface antigen